MYIYMEANYINILLWITYNYKNKTQTTFEIIIHSVRLILLEYCKSELSARLGSRVNIET